MKGDEGEGSSTQTYYIHAPLPPSPPACARPRFCAYVTCVITISVRPLMQTPPVEGQWMERRRALRKRAAPEGGARGQRERAARVDGASRRRALEVMVCRLRADGTALGGGGSLRGSRHRCVVCFVVR